MIKAGNENKAHLKRRSSTISNNNIDILYTSNHNNMPFGLNNHGFEAFSSIQNNEVNGIKSSRILMNTKFPDNSNIITTSRDAFFLGKSNIPKFNQYHHQTSRTMRQKNMMFDRGQNLVSHSKNNSHNISEINGIDMYHIKNGKVSRE